MHSEWQFFSKVHCNTLQAQIFTKPVRLSALSRRRCLQACIPDSLRHKLVKKFSSSVSFNFQMVCRISIEKWRAAFPPAAKVQLMRFSSYSHSRSTQRCSVASEWLRPCSSQITDVLKEFRVSYSPVRELGCTDLPAGNGSSGSSFDRPLSSSTSRDSMVSSRNMRHARSSGERCSILSSLYNVNVQITCHESR